jgi:hypothetical protein
VNNKANQANAQAYSADNAGDWYQGIKQIGCYCNEAVQVKTKHTYPLSIKLTIPDKTLSANRAPTVAANTIGTTLPKIVPMNTVRSLPDIEGLHNDPYQLTGDPADYCQKCGHRGNDENGEQRIARHCDS